VDAAAELGPGSAVDAVRAELRLAFTSPYVAPLVVAGNAGLVIACWQWLPVGLQDWLFHFHGALAFPMVLATWMLADVPATNVLGNDPQRALAVLGDPAALRRLLYAKSVALWLLVCPGCAIVALVVGAATGDWQAAGLIAIWVLLVPAGTLGFSSWLGIYLPYHPRTLAWRWQHRRTGRRTTVRWLTLILAPYGLVPLIETLVLIPAVAIWLATGGEAGTAPLPEDQFLVIVVVSGIVAAAAFLIGHRTAARIAVHRRDDLRAYLSDPERG
jgi:hypothetical protein